MERNIPLAVETNLWDSALISAVWIVPHPSALLDRQSTSNTRSPCRGQSSYFFRGLNDQGSGNHALLHKHSDFNNTTNRICSTLFLKHGMVGKSFCARKCVDVQTHVAFFYNKAPTTLLCFLFGSLLGSSHSRVTWKQMETLFQMFSLCYFLFCLRPVFQPSQQCRSGCTEG